MGVPPGQKQKIFVTGHNGMVGSAIVHQLERKTNIELLTAARVYLFILLFGGLLFMARIARVIAEGMPHHITQRGNRRQQTFFSDDDYRAYIGLMAEWCEKHGVEI